MEEGENMEHPHERDWGTQQIVWGVVVLVVLFGLGAWLYSITGGGVTVEQLPNNQELVRPRQEGQVVPGFPEEFLLEKSASIEDSYSIRYLDDNVEQPVVVYTSSRTLAENVALFREALVSNGWEIVQDADSESAGVTFFGATKENKGINITMAPRDGGATTLVTIAQATQN